MSSPASTYITTFQWIYLFQTVLSGFHPLDLITWGTSTPHGRILNVLSILSYVSPGSASSTANAILMGVVYFFFLLFTGVFSFGLTVYVRSKKGSRFVLEVITIFFHAVLPWLLTVFSGNFGRSLAFAANDTHLVLNLIIALLLGLGALTLILLDSLFITPNLTFRPRTVPILYGLENLSFCLFTSLSHALRGFGSVSRSTGAVVCLFASAVFSALLFAECLPSVLWGSDGFRFHLSVASCLSLVFSLTCSALRAAGARGDPAAFAACAALAALAIYGRKRRRHARTASALAALDALPAEPDVPYWRALGLLRVGFEHGHSRCHDWSLFQWAQARFPLDRRLSIMCVRYAVLYTEDEPGFQLAARQLSTLKRASWDVKMIVRQVRLTRQRRERGFSRTLRKRIPRMMEKTERCRSQMRYIWECIIQRQTGDLDRLARALKAGQEEILTEYHQLCLLYPNNTYVASSFAAFLSDIICSDRDAEAYSALYKKLRSGAWARPEIAASLAARFIPTLPTPAFHAELAQGTAAARRQANAPPETAEEPSQRRHIESMIGGVRLPVMRYGPVLIGLCAVVVVPVIGAALVYEMLRLGGVSTSALDICGPAGKLAVSLLHTPLAVLEHTLALRRFAVGVAGALKTAASDAASAAEAIITHMPRLGSARRGVAAAFTREFAFVDTLNTSEVTTAMSIEQAGEYLAVASIRLSDLPAAAIPGDDDFSIVTRNTRFLYNATDEFLTAIIRTVSLLHDDGKRAVLVFSMALLAPAIALAFAVRVFVTARLVRERSLVFDAFKSLSKASISAVVQKLNDQSGKRVDEAVRTPLGPQEESALRRLRTPTGERESLLRLSDVARGFVLFALWLLAAVALLAYFPLAARALFSTMEAAAPFYRQYVRVHIHLAIVFSCVLRAIAGEALPDAPPDDIAWVISVGHDQILRARERIAELRFGDWRGEVSGLAAVRDRIARLATNSTLNVSALWEDATVARLLAGISYENSLQLLLQMLSETLLELAHNVTDVSDPTTIDMFIGYFFQRSYGEFVTSTLTSVTDAVVETVAERREALTIIGVAILALTVLFGLALLPEFVASGDVVHWFLRLLLLCEPRVVMDSKALFKILSDDFSPNCDETEEASRFFEPLAAASLNPTLFLDNTLSVRSLNRHVCDLLGLCEERLLGAQLFDILHGSDANIASFREFREAVESALLGLCSPCVERDVEIAGIGGARTMHACLVAVNGTGAIHWEPSLPDGIALFTLTLRDLSEALRARQRLDEERARVRTLLSVHLPPCVRDRREASEGTIAYSIPGASFLCVGIDGIEDGDDVIQTLHALFADFDAAVAAQPEMTALKSTGAVYYAIAGAFTEGGQANATALQAVTAALACVAAAHAWNRRETERGGGRAVRVRAAVEVGEKMVAGVIELNVPSFQIMGAPFNEVGRMAEAGPPMSVLITQKVYELVLYAAQFSIREGPTVKLGSEGLRTYIVHTQEE